ncbi:hypothetical protein M407DRAFT_30506 [Tulasnella calospora MUT 4182]|uniref:Uncharacterized protein n=1 Tax=Tulasnella calospora MUT 4182 TaxID=1051891 RepID=A0A0C3Q797_9AGAM|nr:hypothetical protein M407DRAFT_30506 [Tulasnella calospora MUT 4182]
MAPRLSPPPLRGRTSTTSHQQPVALFKSKGAEGFAAKDEACSRKAKALNNPQNYVRSVKSQISDDAEGLDGESSQDISHPISYLDPSALLSRSLALLEVEAETSARMQPPDG